MKLSGLAQVGLFLLCAVLGTAVAHFAILPLWMVAGADPLGQFGVLLLLIGFVTVIVAVGLALLIAAHLSPQPVTQLILVFFLAPPIALIIWWVLGASGADILDPVLLPYVWLTVLLWAVVTTGLRRMRRT